MTFHSSSNFDAIRNDLGELLLSTLAQYAVNRGLGPIDRDSLHQMATPLNDVAGEMLMFGANTWPESARAEEASILPFEAAPSETDPPRSPAILFSTVCLAVAITGSILLHAYFGFGQFSILHLAVVTIAILFGTQSALLAGTVAHGAYNFFVVPPALAFTIPTESEVVMSAFSLSMAVAVPWLIKNAPAWRSRLLTISPNRALTN